MKEFFESYIKPHDKILDIGSKQYHNHQTYKEILPNLDISYVGLDLEPGNNVNIVVENSYYWTEIVNETFDIVISGQTFEHTEFFWLTFEEIVRVLKKNGMICIIAPSAGQIHRYPVDCWRFHPDGMAALAKYTNIDLIDSFVTDRGAWKDCVGIFKK